MIYHENLQMLLRQFEGPLKGVSVAPRSEADALFQPHLANITGVCNIHGKPVVFEVEDFDLRNINGTEDVMKLAGALLEGFHNAAAAPTFKPLAVR